MRNKFFLAIMTTVILLFSAASLASAQNVGDGDKEYKDALGKMMKSSGATAAIDVMIPQIVEMMKQTAPNAPQSLWDSFVEKCKSKFGDKLVELYVPIYKKYMTLDDLNQLIAFYETPIGKKMSTTSPKIMVEGMQIGQKLGMEIANELQTELKSKGY